MAGAWRAAPWASRGAPIRWPTATPRQTRDPRYGQMAPHHGMPPGHLPVSSYLAVPVVARSGEVIGGLFFGHQESDVFTERSERLIAGMAAQAAIAIDNARFYEDARRSADERARLLEAERVARGEIERVSLIKDEFLATLSHELRTPLNAVLGWAEFLLSRASEDGDTRRGLEAIALTAFARSADRTRAMLAGYQVHVSKPIEPQELVATIKSLVGDSGDRGR